MGALLDIGGKAADAPAFFAAGAVGLAAGAGSRERVGVGTADWLFLMSIDFFTFSGVVPNLCSLLRDASVSVASFN